MPPNEWQTYKVPYAHVFSVTIGEAMQAAPDLYESTSTLLLQLGDKISRTSNDERKMLFFHEIIKDIIIRNMQPTTTGDKIVIPSLCTIIKADLKRTAVLADPPDENDAAPMDWLQMEVDVQYSRVVT